MAGKRSAPLKDIFLAGQLTAMALQVNIESLETYVTNCTGFNYVEQCRAVIAFAKTIQHEKHLEQ